MPRHIRCPKCKSEGAVPEGYEKKCIRCPNPACRHACEITSGGEPAAGSEVDTLADAEVRAGPGTDAVPRPRSASPPAQPREPDAGKRPGHGAGSPPGSLPESHDARRRIRWAAATIGGLALATVVVGLGALAMGQDSGNRTHRELEKSARIEDGPRPLPGSAPADTKLAPDLRMAGPVVKNEPPISGVAGGGMAKGEPVGDKPAEDGLAAGSPLTSARADQPPPTSRRPTGDRATAPDVTTEPTSPEPGAAKAEADRVLRSRGLRRNGLVYVLDKEDNVQNLRKRMAVTEREVWRAKAQMAVREKELAQIQATLSNLRQRQRALIDADAMPVPAPAPDKLADPNATQADRTSAQQQREQAGQQQQEAPYDRRQERLFRESRIDQLQSTLVQTQFDYNRLCMFIMTKQDALSRGQADLDMLIGQIRKDYQDLWDDREVRAALSTVNRYSSRTHALGPIEKYQANVQRMAAEVLVAGGYIMIKNGVLVLGADADRQKAKSLEKSIRMELAVTLSRYQGLQGEAVLRMKREADLAAQEARTAADLVAATGPGKPKLAAQFDRLRADHVKFREGQADGVKVLKEVAREVATKRGGFVESVGILGKAVDASNQKRKEVGGNIDMTKALIIYKDGAGRRIKLLPPSFDPDLEKARKAIRVEEVTLVPDRTVLWVAATVNGVQGLKLVLDPSVETVRVAERFAVSVGIVSAREETPVIVSVTMPDGQAIRARRATLKSVQIADFTVHDVACLVLLDGFDAPPVLGASFLDNYVVNIDAEAYKLTLTQVNVPPHVSSQAGSDAGKTNR